jgi:hypothetical protein
MKGLNELLCISNLVLKILRNVNTHLVNIHNVVSKFLRHCKSKFENGTVQSLRQVPQLLAHESACKGH